MLGTTSMEEWDGPASSEQQYERFAVLLRRKEAGDPHWDFDLDAASEREYFESYEREVKGSRSGGFGAHAKRWFDETGMLVLAGLLPIEVIDEPDYETFRTKAWRILSAKILAENLDAGLSAHERLDRAHQALQLPRRLAECKEVRSLLYRAADKLSWFVGFLPVFPQFEILDLGPTLSRAVFFAVAGLEPWVREDRRHHAQWSRLVKRLIRAKNEPLFRIGMSLYAGVGCAGRTDWLDWLSHGLEIHREDLDDWLDCEAEFPDMLGNILKAAAPLAEEMALSSHSQGMPILVRMVDLAARKLRVGRPDCNNEPMSSDEFVRIGRLLYAGDGERKFQTNWQDALASGLGVSPGLIRFWGKKHSYAPELPGRILRLAVPFSEWLDLADQPRGTSIVGRLGDLARSAS